MKVWPKNDDLRQVMRHPTAGPFALTGPNEWPEDTFTYRCLRDGSVVKDDPAPAVVSVPSAFLPSEEFKLAERMDDPEKVPEKARGKKAAKLKI